MNRKTFLGWMTKLRQRGWSAKVTRKGMIRLSPPGKNAHIHCPITALCFERGGPPVGVRDPGKAEEFLKLGDELGMNIITGADCDDDVDMRPSLIKRLGIEEVA